MTTAPAPATRRPRMSLWRLEWLRLTRTRQAIALGALFALIGLIEPIATRYTADLVSRLSHGARVSLPPPAPASGLSSYVNEITLVGLIVVVALAAGALNFDARHGLATFLRTRASGLWQLVAPRVAVYAGAAAAAYLLGTLCAWYETRVLIGSLPAGGVLAGMLCGAVYFAFAVALTAFAASVARATVGIVAIALGILIILPIASAIRPIANWLPSALVGAPAALVNGSHQLSYFVAPLAVTVAAGVVALGIAVRRLQAREI
jgi:ABC-2 type transport system permease protein